MSKCILLKKHIKSQTFFNYREFDFLNKQLSKLKQTSKQQNLKEKQNKVKKQ